MRDNIEWRLVEILEGGIREALIFDTDMNDEDTDDNILWDDKSVLKHPNVQATRQKYWKRFINEIKDKKEPVQVKMAEMTLKQEDEEMEENGESKLDKEIKKQIRM